MLIIDFYFHLWFYFEKLLHFRMKKKIDENNEKFSRMKRENPSFLMRKSMKENGKYWKSLSFVFLFSHHHHDDVVVDDVAVKEFFFDPDGNKKKTLISFQFQFLFQLFVSLRFLYSKWKLHTKISFRFLMINKIKVFFCVFNTSNSVKVFFSSSSSLLLLEKFFWTSSFIHFIVKTRKLLSSTKKVAFYLK